MPIRPRTALRIALSSLSYKSANVLAGDSHFAASSSVFKEMVASFQRQNEFFR